MTQGELKTLRRLLKKALRLRKLPLVFFEIRKALAETYFEDNEPTREHFFHEELRHPNASYGPHSRYWS